MIRGDVVTYGKNRFAVVWKSVSQKLYLLPILILPHYRHRADVFLRSVMSLHPLFMDGVVRCCGIVLHTQGHVENTELSFPEHLMKLCDLALKREAEIQAFENNFRANHTQSLQYFLRHIREDAAG